MTQHAWRCGVSPYTGVVQYMVKSSDQGKPAYWPTVHENGRQGGFCYSLDGRVVVWIRCNCIAADRPIPCWHAAKVQRSLEWGAAHKRKEAA